MFSVRLFLTLFLLFSLNFTLNSFASYYRGFASCGEYLSAIDNDKYFIWNDNVTFVEGYMSGYNTFIELGAVGSLINKIEIPDRDTIKYSLEKFCRDNPTSNIFNGVLSLTNELRE